MSSLENGVEIMDTPPEGLDVPASEEETETASENEEQEPAKGEPQTPKKEEDISKEELLEKNRQLFARAKKAEEELKRIKSSSSSENKSSVDEVKLIKTLSVLKDYSEEEIDFAKTIAEGKKVPLAEAVKTEEFREWLTAHRNKVVNNQATPEPSSASVSSAKTHKDIAKMSSEEFQRYEEEMLKKKRGGTGI